jgi:hypothetical protein
MRLIREPFRPPSTPQYLFSSYLKTEMSWHKFLGVEQAAVNS